jgi:hypothetical protein
MSSGLTNRCARTGIDGSVQFLAASHNVLDRQSTRQLPWTMTSRQQPHG